MKTFAHFLFSGNLRLWFSFSLSQTFFHINVLKLMCESVVLATVVGSYLGCSGGVCGSCPSCAAQFIWHNKTKPPCDIRTSQSTSPDTNQNIHATSGLHNRHHHLTNKTKLPCDTKTSQSTSSDTRQNLHVTSDQDFTTNIIIWHNKAKPPCDTRTSQSNKPSDTPRQKHPRDIKTSPSKPHSRKPSKVSVWHAHWISKYSVLFATHVAGWIYCHHINFSVPPTPFVSF